MNTIALLTDFGLVDNYVGVLKGVILKINPQARIVDLGHQIKPQNILPAGFLLSSSYKYFSPGTIFLVVVDPGVGSARNPIIIRGKNYFFVGPDNGVLSLAACADGVKKIIRIENKKYFLQPVSRTFHARDIFAPAAAHLALGKNLNSFGRALNSFKRLNWTKAQISKTVLKGEIIYIDKFGNLVTNIEQGLLKRFIRKKKFKIKIKNITIDSVANSYQAAKPGLPLAIVDSFGFLEISVNQGSAEGCFAAKKGLTVTVQIK